MAFIFKICGSVLTYFYYKTYSLNQKLAVLIMKPSFSEMYF